MIGNAESKKEVQVVKILGNLYIVWISNGNQYIGFEEPAYYVYTCYQERLDRKIVTQRFAETYQTSLSESGRFVNEILDRIESVIQWKDDTKPLYKNKVHTKTFNPFSIHHYRINNKNISFHYETKLHEFYLHPLIQHLETSFGNENTVHFELFEEYDQLALRVNNQLKGIWSMKETHLMKGMVFMQILNIAYGKTDVDWMAIIHASAVTDGSKSIVFTGPPGSGKSTIAALLHQFDYKLVSDDFVPIESESLCVFPFEVALSVKEGSNELLSEWYSDLKNGKPHIQSVTNKKVKYLPIKIETIPVPVHEIIFIKYDTNIDFNMKTLGQAESLSMLLEETWTSPTPVNAQRFLDWYSNITCYQLTYSNNDKAIQAIAKLFEK